jgi:hypothetical protein
VQKENIWVSKDKTTDENGRRVANVVIEILKDDQKLSEKSFFCHARKCMQ